MNNGFNPIYGVDSLSLQLLLDPLVLLEAREEEIKEKNNRKFSKSSVVTELTEDSEDITDLFEPKFKYVRHKKTKVILKRIRF